MIPIAEQERLLMKRARRELEKQGYKLLSSKTGGLQIQSAINGEVVAGPNYELTVFEAGRFAGIWGYSTTENVKEDVTAAEAARQRMIYRHSRIPDERDPITGKITPEYAAALEQMGAQ